MVVGAEDDEAAGDEDGDVAICGAALVVQRYGGIGMLGVIRKYILRVEYRGFFTKWEFT